MGNNVSSVRGQKSENQGWPEETGIARGLGSCQQRATNKDQGQLLCQRQKSSVAAAHRDLPWLRSLPFQAELSGLPVATSVYRSWMDLGLWSGTPTV